ncbi:polysaccharide deacetylase family protein [Streptomyces megasporus]|uniref:polysaccharide deacetylase family protein n=1 Tax=Streptomyces megasporus TaxID=44060 RepID=UPI0004E22BEB|nr:polysaccharide deacetylase family protein [Streptomyces megasporus]
MTVSVRRTTVPLTALALVTAAVAGCAGPGGDTTRAGASPVAASSPASAAPRSPSPEGGASKSASASPSASPSPTGWAGLPASASGRTPVFRHGPRAAENDDRGEKREKTEKGEEREEREERGGREKGRDRQDKVVALTFDAVLSVEDEKAAKDRKDSKDTEGAENAEGAKKEKRHDNPALVATLRREKIPATFFMTGLWAKTYPHQARAIGRERLFEVGNLSYSHRAFTSDCEGLTSLDPDKRLADVRKGLEAIRAAGVENPTPYFRFPGGCHDDEARKAIGPAKVTAVAGDVDGRDVGADDPEKIAERVLKEVRPGSVVILRNDRDRAKATEKAVRHLVPELRERGYRLVRVSEMIDSALGR